MSQAKGIGIVKNSCFVSKQMVLTDPEETEGMPRNPRDISEILVGGSLVLNSCYYFW